MMKLCLNHTDITLDEKNYLEAYLEMLLLIGLSASLIVCKILLCFTVSSSLLFCSSCFIKKTDIRSVIKKKLNGMCKNTKLEMSLCNMFCVAVSNLVASSCSDLVPLFMVCGPSGVSGGVKYWSKHN